MPFYKLTFEQKHTKTVQVSCIAMAMDIVEARRVADDYVSRKNLTLFEICQIDAPSAIDPTSFREYIDLKGNFGLMSEEEIREWLTRFCATAFMEGVNLMRQRQRFTLDEDSPLKSRKKSKTHAYGGCIRARFNSE